MLLVLLMNRISIISCHEIVRLYMFYYMNMYNTELPVILTPFMGNIGSVYNKTSVMMIIIKL